MRATNFTITTLAFENVPLLEGLLTLFGEAFEDTGTYGDKPPSQTYLKRLLGDDHIIALVALKHDKVVGGLVAYVLQKFEQERSEVYIYDLAVASGHRREGIATALIQQLKDISITRGASVIFVQADRSDGPAIALYTKLGVREDVLHFDISLK